jgi:EAL domain-containing protein (putative c-di-GMP-specific phosphodiesterase class I)
VTASFFEDEASSPRSGGSASGRSTEPALKALLAAGQVRSVYQPIVELDTGSVIAYEALARGPVGSELERPDLMFAAAHRAGCVNELDRACRAAALAGFREARLTDPWTLFVNVEPQAAHEAFRLTTVGTEAGQVGADAPQIVVELTERALTADPTQVLRLVERIRARGWGIAIDDVGADRNSLALLPLLRPDVIKLDLRLVQERASADIAEIASAVNAEAERSGTTVLAEGIETDAHLAVAKALGATLGQGWLLGRPGPLPAADSLIPRTRIALRTQAPHVVSEPSPFALGARKIALRQGPKTLLIEISKHLERQAMRSGESAVVLASFQDASFFTPDTRIRYARLVESAAFVGALGSGMPSDPMPGVRGGHLDVSDPVIGEWDIAVVGPHFAATLLARDLGDNGPDGDRRFKFLLSHDRELAIAVATSLISRIAPEVNT